MSVVLALILSPPSLLSLHVNACCFWSISEYNYSSLICFLQLKLNQENFHLFVWKRDNNLGYILSSCTSFSFSLHLIICNYTKGVCDVCIWVWVCNFTLNMKELNHGTQNKWLISHRQSWNIRKNDQFHTTLEIRNILTEQNEWSR